MYPSTDNLFAAGILDHFDSCRDPQCCFVPLSTAAFGDRHVLRMNDGDTVICLCTTGADHGEDGFDQPAADAAP